MLGGLAEVCIRGAVEIGYCFLPLGLKALEEVRGHSYERGSSINDSWIAALLSYLWQTIEQSLASQSPCLNMREYVGIVPEGLKATGASDNLLLVDTTENRETALITQAQTEGRTADHALLHERPHQMLIVSVRAHLRRQSEDTVRPLIKSLALRQTQELEVDTFLVFLQAGPVLGLLALELC